MAAMAATTVLPPSHVAIATSASRHVLNRSSCHRAAAVAATAARASGLSGDLRGAPLAANATPLRRQANVITVTATLKPGEQDPDHPYPFGDSVESLPYPGTFTRDASAQPRRGGVLLHPTCLPGPESLGTLGPAAHSFIDWLADSGLSVWQVLPLVPPDADGSPYSSSEAFSGSPWMIDLGELRRLGLLEEGEGTGAGEDFGGDWKKYFAFKDPLLKKAARRLLSGLAFSSACSTELLQEFLEYRAQTPWLQNAALFRVLDEVHGGVNFWEWPEEYRDRDERALREFGEKWKNEVEDVMAVQFLFERQWQALRKKANARGIQIIGDMPIYVAGHSTSVWVSPSMFMVDPVTKRPTQLTDICRIDHFRAFAGYYAIPAGAASAKSGEWLKGPGPALFDACRKALGKRVPIIAEDLGVITTDVVSLREGVGAPGMAVLQFAFGGDGNNVHLPHNHYNNCFVYPGTHDNNTTVGWWQSASKDEQRFAQMYIGKNDGEDVAWDLVRQGFASVGNVCVVAMQDYLGSTTPELAAKIRGALYVAGRIPKQRLDVMPVGNRTPANWDEIMNDDTKDVIIKFYAPWCKYCNQLEPKYAELGKRYQAIPSVTVAQMDITTNSKPAAPFEFKTIPSIFLKKAGGEVIKMDYPDGKSTNVTLEYLETFIKANANTRFAMKFAMPDSRK
eukprot:jgi/Chlat1/7674/Chrsp64S07177